ncbi:MAG: GNAT family N-acyltransferase [Pseudomonadota bacterium]
MWATSLAETTEPGWSLTGGTYRVRPARSKGDIDACLGLRSAVFRAGAPDQDRFDPACTHILVEPLSGGPPVVCCRLLALDGADDGYTAQFYDFASLAASGRRLVELGRFCAQPGGAEADALRLAWAGLAEVFTRAGIDTLIGCSSFVGTDPGPATDALLLLRARYLGPRALRPAARALETVPFDKLPDRAPDPRVAFRQMPPLLRGYLALGAWVSDQVVIDRDLGTLHVFTALDMAAIPLERADALRRTGP